MILFSRAEFLTQRHENFTLTVASGHIRFAEMAAQMISHLAGLDIQAPPPNPQGPPRLAALPR
jgi:outer membrane biogenesis lipoprotein LolB